MNCSTFPGSFPSACPSTGVELSSRNDSSRPFVQIDLTVAIVFSVLDATGIVFGALANIVMIALVLTQSHLRSTTDIFTCSLCVSDLFAGVLFQPFVIRRLLARSPNPPYEWALRRFVGQLTLSASSMSLCTATIDRYVVLRWPLRHSAIATKAKALCIIGSMWLISLALGLTAYYERELSAFVFPLVSSIVVALIVLFQVLIFIIAKNQVKKIWHFSRQSRRGSRAKFLRQMKATKTIILLLTVFLISWLPSTVFRFYDRLSGGDICTFHEWLHVLNTLIQIHCCLDPYLYVLRDRRFRLAIAKILKKNLKSS